MASICINFVNLGVQCVVDIRLGLLWPCLSYALPVSSSRLFHNNLTADWYPLALINTSQNVRQLILIDHG
jgi:hypothetical protein